jgi:cell division septation protein DedD
MGSARTSEPPVIKAEPGPNKIVPPSATAAADGKPIQDRLGGAAPERLVSREEQPVNVQDATKAGPRVVFPPLNQNANPPSTASVSPSNKPMVGNGAMQGDEPRKIRTFAVKGDQSDAGATPAARQAPARIAAPAAVPAAAPAAAPRATNANASANAPMSLSPQAAPPAAAAPPAPSRMASTNPTQQAAPVASGGGYVVQVSSQRSEGDAQASFRALQTKFPSVLGSRAPLIKKADLGDKGTYYRAMVGPFGSQEEASQVCGNLKSAGGQCVVQRN